MGAMNRVFLTLGSNVNKEANMPAAVRLLRESVDVVAVSAVYETAPQGTQDQPRFFNAAVLIETDLDPPAIKEQLIARVESALSRQRQADKNAPRTIDVDIALFNDAVMEYVPGDGQPRHIPDPDLLESLHAIVPVAELAPNMAHPETGERLAAIAVRLREQAGGRQGIWLREDVSLTD